MKSGDQSRFYPEACSVASPEAKRSVEFHAELLRCPFCGRRAALEEIEIRGNPRVVVGCGGGDCIMFMAMAFYYTRTEAIRAWNHRCDLPPNATGSATTGGLP